MFGSSFLGLDDVLHLFSLPLGGDVASESLLDEFQGSFVLTDSEQFNDSSFVGGVTAYFSDDVVDEGGFLGLHALVSALAVLVAGEFGGFVTLVWSNYHSGDSHV